MGIYQHVRHFRGSPEVGLSVPGHDIGNYHTSRRGYIEMICTYSPVEHIEAQIHSIPKP